MTKNEAKKMVDIINTVVEQAVIHGGDAGGPYFVNYESLDRALCLFLTETQLGKFCAIQQSTDTPIIVLR